MRSTATRLTFLWLGCLIMAIACASAWAEIRGEITGVKLDPEKKNLVISTKGVAGKHQARVIGSPNRLVIDLAGTGVSNIPRKVPCGHLDIQEIRIGNSGNGARIVVDFRNQPVPPYNINRNENQIEVAFGASLAADLTGASEASDKTSKEGTSRKSPLDPSFVPAAAEAGSQATLGAQLKAAATADGSKGAANEKLQSAPAGEKITATKGLTDKPASTEHIKLAGAPGAPPLRGGIPTAERGGAVPNVAPENARMVREVRPPVTPPTPDPRLLVQEITELKFIQVGHNARLIVRGGDGLDYRLNKVSPTKVRIDLINAEIPKVHQKPLRTDLFSTSVEMIIPGSQTIFVQLKDAVPYQVEKKKGVLMVDFPPPRFSMAQYREGGGVGVGLGGGETTRIFREEQIHKETDSYNKQIERLQKEQEQLQKQRIEIIKKYQVSPDPEVFNKPVTMDFQGIALKNAFRLLAEQAGINIIVGDGVQGTTTVRLFEVPLGQVIDTIVNAHNLDREMIGNVMRIDKQDAMKKLKEERQREYTARIEEVDIRLDNDPTNIPKGAKGAEKRKAAGLGIRQQIEEYEKKIARITQELQKLQEAPVEDTRTEDIGEAGCIMLDGEQVCFNYATIRLSYAKPADLVRTLDCIFNLNCKGGVGAAATSTFVEDQEAAFLGGMYGGAAGMQQYSQYLQDQGFSPDSPGYRSRMQSQAVTQAQLQSAQAQTTSAAALASGAAGQRKGVQVSVAFGEDPRLAKIIANSRIWPDEVNRMIFIKDTPDRIAQMKKMIFILDVPQPQILLESRFVVVDRNWSRGLGIIWGGMNDQSGLLSNNRKVFWGLTGETGVAARNSALGGSPPPLPDGTLIPNQYVVNLPSTASAIMGLGATFGFLAGNYLTQLDMRLQVGESFNKAKVLARPKVQVLNKQKASIKRGLSIPYQTVSIEGTQTQMINADLKLDVRPTIYPDGRIQMWVKITNNEPVPPADVPGTTSPSIRTREAETYLIIKDGDTAVMGGLLQDTTDNARAGWPGLMNVPLIGNLFSNKFSSSTATEMLIFLTPSIIRRPPPAS